MKRGRPATTGIKDAVAIAQKRGCVMQIVYASDSVCDFLIRTAALVIFARIVRFEKIIAPVSEIEHECRGIIAELQLFPRSEQIRLELWIYSKHGTYRFFRVTDAGLKEIQQNGELATGLTAEGEAPPDTITDTVPDTVPVTGPSTGNKGEPVQGRSPTETSGTVVTVGTSTLPGHAPPVPSSGESTVGESGGGRRVPE